MRPLLQALAAAALVAVAIVGCVDEDPVKAAPPQGGQTAVLLLDYKTAEFLGGAVLDAPDCPTCSADSLPVDVHYRAPGDFGSIAITYRDTADTLFAGTIIWMGQGAMSHPADPDKPAAFPRLRCFAEPPEKVERIRPGDWPPANTMAAEFPDLWRRVADLELAHRFAGTPDGVAALYLYPPTVGMFDPDRAVWVLFLHSAAGFAPLTPEARGCGS